MSMHIVMEMWTVVTTIASGTMGEDTPKLMQRIKHARRRMSKVPATVRALADWGINMERAAQQQSRKQTQVHRTIAMIGNTLETQSALQEAQWRAIKIWLEEIEAKWDAYHQDDVLWGIGITDMVTELVAATERGQRDER